MERSVSTGRYSLDIENRLPGFTETYPKGVQLSDDVKQLLDHSRTTRQALTFDEVTLEDKPSDFHPNDCSLHSFVTRNIRLKSCGILSAAMDTVTERDMALAMAKMGGMGILHRNLGAQEQAAMVSWVRKKIHYGGMIDKPITFSPNDRYSYLQNQIANKGWTFTSFPIVDEEGKFLGLMTRDELEFVEGTTNPLLSQLMKPLANVVTAPEGTSSDDAYKLMQTQRVKKLPIVSSTGVLIGMYVWNDVKQDQRKRDFFSLDNEGHFLVGAAISLGQEDMHRADLLVQSGCKVLVLDSSHGACAPAKEQIKRLRVKYGDRIDIIVGNIASYASAAYLLKGDHRPDCLKVGIGPGSICTTRSVTGHGVPQLTAVYEVWRAVKDHGDKTGYY
ncbi:inosine 5'-monophosphate dehydrogenase, partial [Planoprotostelium fungivorum]